MPEKKKTKKIPKTNDQITTSPLQTPNSQLKTYFYEKVLDEAEKVDFAAVWGNNTIDDEIALLKVKIKAIVEKDPENIKLILQATNLLIKLVKTRYSMNKEQKKGFKDALENVIKEIAVPLGIAVINKKM